MAIQLTGKEAIFPYLWPKRTHGLVSTVRMVSAMQCASVLLNFLSMKPKLQSGAYLVGLLA